MFPKVIVTVNVIVNLTTDVTDIFEHIIPIYYPYNLSLIISPAEPMEQREQSQIYLSYAES